MNRYPLWKYLVLALALVVGLLYALPNVFGEAPAVQVSSGKVTVKVDSALLNRGVGDDAAPSQSGAWTPPSPAVGVMVDTDEDEADESTEGAASLVMAASSRGGRK